MMEVTMGEVLVGGCVLFRLPIHQPPVEPIGPKIWRPMTEEERTLALAFGERLVDTRDQLWGCDLAVAMFNRAMEDRDITDKQGNAIYAIARHYRIIPPTSPRRYTADDIPELRAEIARAPEENRERLERIMRLLELGCDRVDADRRGLLVNGIHVGPNCWKPASGGAWQRYEDLAEVVAQVRKAS
jgi:hypothetical protein